MKISVSGIRGIFGKDLMLDDVIKFSKRFVMLLKEKGIESCVVARDTRASSKIISDTVIATLLTFGINVYNLNIAPTPFLFREARKYNAGVMVTSSHNPLEWNGLKFIIEGRGLFEDELSQLLSIKEAEYYKIAREYDIKSEYMDDLLALDIKSSARVAIDNAGGAVSNYAQELLNKIGCRVYSLSYDKPDQPDPTTKDLSSLANLITSNRCDIGFAYDLDGDRLVVMDKHGNKLNPDATLLLAIAKMHDLKINKFAVSIDTSNAIKEFLESKGSSLTYSKVGEANLVRVMLENGIEAGGEGSSGGFVFRRFNMCRDGLLASALISSMIDSKDYEECIELSNKYTIIRSKMSAPSMFHDALMDTIANKLEQDSYETSRLDGIKGYIDENTWILIRTSNTEDVIRLSVESDDSQRAKILLRDYEELIRDILESL